MGLENAFYLSKKIIEKNLSVRQAENLVKIFKNKKIPKKLIKDSNLNDLEISLSNQIGINVRIKNKRNNTGLISFEYKDLDQLNKLIDTIKSNY